ncbi:MAG: hypothetical protein LQ338_008321 [Usnochroma carphineum]|nr:MAG: hypothetical protein LQ338_008321 [Usnochroma carphineum]
MPAIRARISPHKSRAIDTGSHLDSDFEELSIHDFNVDPRILYSDDEDTVGGSRPGNPVPNNAGQGGTRGGHGRPPRPGNPRPCPMQRTVHLKAEEGIAHTPSDSPKVSVRMPFAAQSILLVIALDLSIPYLPSSSAYTASQRHPSGHCAGLRVKQASGHHLLTVFDLVMASHQD